MAHVKTIFIVDDDTTQFTMLQDHLSKLKKITVHTFNSGEDCLKNLHLNPQIIFLDYNFENPSAMNGIEVLKKIKSEKPKIEVVMLSAQDKIQVAINSIKNDAYDYIVKGEGAFVRSEKVIFNINRYLKLKEGRKVFDNLIWILLAIIGVLVYMVLKK